MTGEAGLPSGQENIHHVLTDVKKCADFFYFPNPLDPGSRYQVP